IRPALAAERDLAIQADMLLGQCLRNIGDDDRAVLVFRRVIAGDPTNARARFGVVKAVLAQGRADAALAECEDLMKMPPPPAAGWLLSARLLILQNLRLPPAQRHWERVDAAVDRAQQMYPGATLLPVVRAEALVGRGKPELARRTLEAARDKLPKEV